MDSPYAEDATNEIMDLFRRMQTNPADTGKDQSKEGMDSDSRNHTRIFLMQSLQQVIEVSAIIAESYHGQSSLYKAEPSARSREGYLLVLTQGDESPESFDKACNIVSEYGIPQRAASAGAAFLEEHCEALIKADAVHALGAAS